MDTVPVILAGGIGERFWPLSRSSNPKQMLRLLGKRTMAEETLARVAPLYSDNVRPLLVTGTAIAKKIRSVIPKKWAYDTIIEPIGKNTAPAIALASIWVHTRYEDAVMVVLSADHAIEPKQSFVETVRYGVLLAESHDSLVVFGIKPSRPETGYGYVQLGEPIENDTIIKSYHVQRFVEKPNYNKAKHYMNSGEYMWNSGIFIWKTSTILDEFKAYMPKLYRQAKKVAKEGFSKESVENYYKNCDKESIDYGIMEHSQRVLAVVGDFMWDDIGSWESIPRLHPSNEAGTTVVGSRVFESECNNSIIVNKSSHVVATIGLKDVAVITTDDAVLVVERSKVPDLKKYLGQMKQNGRFPKKLF